MTESRLMKVAMINRSSYIASKQPGASNGSAGPHSPSRAAPNSNAMSHLKSEVAKLNGKVNDLNLSIEGLEKERDFYFSKLRDLEIKCQQNPNSSALPVQTVLDILYSTEEGFATPE